jgi:hypothetical protein
VFSGFGGFGIDIATCLVQEDGKMKQEHLDQLEELIDAYTLEDVIKGLEEICQGKAMHIESNWQDKVTARPWWRIAGRLGTLATHCDV